MKKNLLRYGTQLVLVTALVGGLAGCGVKSQPKHPDGSDFPRQYPTALPPLTTVPEKQNGAQKQTGTPVSDPDSFYQYPNTPPQ
jgi:uncharacterized lipoprotein